MNFVEVRRQGGGVQETTKTVRKRENELYRVITAPRCVVGAVKTLPFIIRFPIMPPAYTSYSLRVSKHTLYFTG